LNFIKEHSSNKLSASANSVNSLISNNTTNVNVNININFNKSKKEAAGD